MMDNTELLCYANSLEIIIIIIIITATHKTAKYTDMPSQLVFHPIAVETHGPLIKRVSS